MTHNMVNTYLNSGQRVKVGPVGTRGLNQLVSYSGQKIEICPQSATCNLTFSTCTIDIASASIVTDRAVVSTSSSVKTARCSWLVEKNALQCGYEIAEWLAEVEENDTCLLFLSVSYFFFLLGDFEEEAQKICRGKTSAYSKFLAFDLFPVKFLSCLIWMIVRIIGL